MMIHLLLACTNSSHTDTVSIELDSGLQKENSFSIVYDGQSFANEATLSVESAPAGMRHQHQFAMQLSNHSAQQISVSCDQDWEINGMFIASCPETIAAHSSETMVISFTPETLTEATHIALPLNFPEQDYFLDFEISVPEPLITLFFGDSGYLLKSMDYGQTVEVLHSDGSGQAKTIIYGDGLFRYQRL